MLELPRKRLKVSEDWRHLERKENIYRSEDPVPSGKWVKELNGCFGRRKAEEPRHWSTGEEATLNF